MFVNVYKSLIGTTPMPRSTVLPMVGWLICIDSSEVYVSGIFRKYHGTTKFETSMRVVLNNGHVFF